VILFKDGEAVRSIQGIAKKEDLAAALDELTAA